MRRASRSAPRPCSGGRRRATARSSTSAPPTARSTRSTRRPAGAGGRSTRRRRAPRFATATTSTARRRSASAASTSAASTAGLVRPLRLLPQASRCALRHRPGPGVRRRPRPDVFVTPGGTTQRRDSEKVPPATVLATRLVVRRTGSTVNAPHAPGAGRHAGQLHPASLPDPALRRRPLPLHPADGLLANTDYQVRVHGNWAAALPPVATPARWIRPCASTPHGRRGSCPSVPPSGW